MKLIQSGSPQRWVHAALSGRTADSARIAYFAVLSEIGQNVLTKGDRKIIAKLSKEVQDEIGFRNWMLHDVLYRLVEHRGHRLVHRPKVAGRLNRRRDRVPNGRAWDSPLRGAGARPRRVGRLPRLDMTQVALQRRTPGIAEVYEIAPDGKARRMPNPAPKQNAE